MAGSLNHVGVKNRGANSKISRGVREREGRVHVDGLEIYMTAIDIGSRTKRDRGTAKMLFWPMAVLIGTARH